MAENAAALSCCEGFETGNKYLNTDNGKVTITIWREYQSMMGGAMNLSIDLNMMTIQYFVTVADTGNMTKAAGELYLTQPTLSRQIAALEQTLGVTLFNRTKGGVELTERGKVFYKECRELLDAYNLFSSKAFEFRNMTVGSITTGFYKQNEVDAINLNNEFFKLYPNVDVRGKKMGGLNYYEELAMKNCDCIFVYEEELDPSEKEIERERVQQLEFRLMVSRANPLSERDSVKLSELANEKFILPSERSNPRKNRHLMEVIQKYGGFTPTVADTAVYYLDYVMRCVYHNAVYVSPFIPFVGEYPQVKFLKLEDYDEPYNIDLVWMKANKNPILPIYTDFVKRKLAENSAGAVIEE